MFVKVPPLYCTHFFLKFLQKLNSLFLKRNKTIKELGVAIHYADKVIFIFFYCIEFWDFYSLEREMSHEVLFSNELMIRFFSRYCINLQHNVVKQLHLLKSLCCKWLIASFTFTLLYASIIRKGLYKRVRN